MNFQVLRLRAIDLEDSRMLEQFREAAGAAVETGAEDHDLSRAIANCRVEPLVDEMRTHNQDAGRSGNLHLLRRVFIRSIQCCCERMLSQESQLIRTKQLFRQPVPIADMTIGLSGTNGPRCGGPDRGS